MLFLTSLFAAALAFHNCVWRYIFALGRENVLPAALGRTGGQQHPQGRLAGPERHRRWPSSSSTRWPGGTPMTDLFFWLGTTGGFGILILLAAHLGRGDRVLRPRPARRERLAAADRPRAGRRRCWPASWCWPCRTTPRCSASAPGSPAAWALPASYAAVAVIGLAWAADPAGPPPGGLRRDRAGRPRRHRPARRRRPASRLHDRPPRSPARPAPAGPGGHGDRRGHPGAQPGHRRGVLRPAAVPVADPRPGRPPRGSSPATSGSTSSTPWPAASCTPPPAATPPRCGCPAGENPPDLPDGYAAALAAVTGPYLDRFTAFDAALDQRHPAGIAHHHLAILAVRADRQGQGTGTALLDAYHASSTRHPPARLPGSLQRAHPPALPAPRL